jgi:hypothetical protein
MGLSQSRRCYPPPPDPDKAVLGDSFRDWEY